MGIEYRFHTGYGFLLPEKKFALPAEWNDCELWDDGEVDKALSGSGLESIFGGSQWSGEHVWGFVAKDTHVSISGRTDTVVEEVRDVDPVVVGNLFDMKSRVKMPRARVGWMMWVDVY